LANTDMAYRGVYSIPVTPFEEDGSLDRDSLRRCVSFCVDAGAHGIVLPVNASEAPRLTDAERDEVLAIGVKTVDRAVPFIGGVSGISLQHCVERTKVAVDAGVDSVMAMPPNGISGEQQALEFYGALSEAGGVPVWVQNNKPPTGPTLPTPTLIEMIEKIPNVDYLKEESLLPGHVITAVLEACGDSCKGIMGGMGGRYLLDEYRRGSCGTMPAGHITEAHVALWDALERGGTDGEGMQVVTDEAVDIFQRMLPSLNFESLFGVTVYKQAFWRRGIIKTPTVRVPGRRPFDRQDGEELDRILDRLTPLINMG
jgi:dihydrodipicolinate synthase/N-acetylneuraminate lyase